MWTRVHVISVGAGSTHICWDSWLTTWRRVAARVIAESVIQEISTNGALSTWFTRVSVSPVSHPRSCKALCDPESNQLTLETLLPQETSPAPAAIKKPNPKNEENQTKEKELLAQLESYVPSVFLSLARRV